MWQVKIQKDSFTWCLNLFCYSSFFLVFMAIYFSSFYTFIIFKFSCFSDFSICHFDVNFSRRCQYSDHFTFLGPHFIFFDSFLPFIWFSKLPHWSSSVQSTTWIVFVLGFYYCNEILVQSHLQNEWRMQNWNHFCYNWEKHCTAAIYNGKSSIVIQHLN